MFKRSSVVLVVLALLLLLVSGMSVAKDYKLVFSNYASEVDKTSEIFRYFAQRLEEKTDGQVTFRTFYGGSMGGPAQMIHLVGNGTVDVGVYYVNYYPAEFPLNLVKSTPYTGFKPDSVVKAYDKLKEEFPEIRAEYEKLNLKHLMTFGSSATLAPVITKNKKLMSMEDMKNLRARAAGRDAVTVSGWGMVPVKLAWPEIYEGFVRGVVDAVYGVDFNTTILDLHLAPEAKYFMNPGAGTPGTLDMVMNKDTYESFPPEIQKAINEALEEAKAFDLELRTKFQTKAINQLLEAGSVYYQPPADVVEQMRVLGATSAYRSWIKDCVDAGISRELAEKVLNRYIELNKQYDKESNWKSIAEEIKEIQAK